MVTIGDDYFALMGNVEGASWACFPRPEIRKTMPVIFRAKSIFVPTNPAAEDEYTAKRCDCEHDFTLVLSGITELTPEVMNALFEAGCDDGTIALRSGRPYMAFSASAIDERRRSTRNRLFRSAGIGADVLRVDYCNLVTQADIARKIGRSRQLVHQYMTGERGPGAFPMPACAITEKVPLWFWCEVAYWLWENNLVKEDVLRDAQEVETINSVLDLQRQKKENPELTQEIIRSVSPKICS